MTFPVPCMLHANPQMAHLVGLVCFADYGHHHAVSGFSLGAGAMASRDISAEVVVLLGQTGPACYVGIAMETICILCSSVQLCRALEMTCLRLISRCA